MVEKTPFEPGKKGTPLKIAQRDSSGVQNVFCGILGERASGVQIYLGPAKIFFTVKKMSVRGVLPFGVMIYSLDVKPGLGGSSGNPARATPPPIYHDLRIKTT